VPIKFASCGAFVTTALYVPRDFDISPFFEVVKPRIAKTFDYQHAPWSEGNTVVMDDAAQTELLTVIPTDGASDVKL
jgi:hypothetical protein